MKWKKTIGAIVATTLITGCYSGEESEDGSAERMRNAVATIVTGVAAQEIYGSTSVDATLQRPLNLNSRIEGTTTPKIIDLRMKIPLKDNRFVAHRVNGMLVGEQDKRMFDWSVQQVDENTYKVNRVGFDGELDINIDGNFISGKYHKPMGLDFSFSGEMRDGAYHLEMDLPLKLDWEINGTVVPR